MKLRHLWIAYCLLSVVACLGMSQTPKKKGGKKGGPVDTSNPAYKDAPVSTAADTSGKPAPPAGFIHPGVLVNKAQLDEIKKRVAKGTEPQKTAFAALKESKLSALDYTPNPRDTVECGSYSNPDLGCKDEQNDSEAAYAQALMWYVTGNTAYAQNAVKIMDAWANTLTGAHTNSNAEVQASWAGAVWPRAAEIIRYSYKGWSDAQIAKFQNMLTTQYLPNLIHGTCENGNKELTMAEAIVNIGVFNDNRAAFDFGVKMWRGRAPATIYLKSDGPMPLEAVGCGLAIWGNKGFTPEFVDGLEQETARDSQHASMAFAGMVDTAETARQQGIDLYAEVGKRIVAAMEFQAQYLPPNNARPPENLEFNLHPTWEIAYNEFHNRLGQAVPKMAAVITGNRPTGVNHHMNWETLTHGDIGKIGLPPIKQ
jgi:alginate lyase